MYGPDIGSDVRTTTGSVERTCRIDGFRQFVQVLHQTRILNTVGPELFIGWCPDQDRRMISVAFHDFGPFGDEVTGCFDVIAIHSPAGGFTPSQVTQFVCPVIETFFEYFLMQAGTVETGFHRKLDIFLQGFVARSCPDTVGIESLVEYQTLIVRLVVQVDFLAFDVDFPHTGIRFDFIYYISGLVDHP